MRVRDSVLLLVVVLLLALCALELKRLAAAHPRKPTPVPEWHVMVKANNYDFALGVWCAWHSSTASGTNYLQHLDALKAAVADARANGWPPFNEQWDWETNK